MERRYFKKKVQLNTLCSYDGVVLTLIAKKGNYLLAETKRGGRVIHLIVTTPHKEVIMEGGKMQIACDSVSYYDSFTAYDSLTNRRDFIKDIAPRIPFPIYLDDKKITVKEFFFNKDIQPKETIVWDYALLAYTSSEYVYRSSPRWSRPKHPHVGYRPFHRTNHMEYNPSITNPYGVGLEIEKVDEIHGEFDKTLVFETYKWSIETDASLWRDEEDPLERRKNEYAHYEMVSPTLPLKEDMMQFFPEELHPLINGKTTNKCGGHIHLSEYMKSGGRLFDSIKGYLPLLYSIYSSRVDNYYCRGKLDDDLKNSSEKYQAVRIFSDRIEFRIFPEVKNLNQLLWRIELVRLMTIYKAPKATDVVKMMLKRNHEVRLHLRKVFTERRVEEIAEGMIDMGERFRNFNCQETF